MVVRWIIDVLEGRIELDEGMDRPEDLSNQPAVLHIASNRFIPRDFVFRCKVVRCG